MYTQLQPIQYDPHTDIIQPEHDAITDPDIVASELTGVVVIDASPVVGWEEYTHRIATRDSFGEVRNYLAK